MITRRQCFCCGHMGCGPSVSHFFCTVSVAASLLRCPLLDSLPIFVPVLSALYNSLVFTQLRLWRAGEPAEVQRKAPGATTQGSSMKQALLHARAGLVLAAEKNVFRVEGWRVKKRGGSFKDGANGHLKVANFIWNRQRTTTLSNSRRAKKGWSECMMDEDLLEGIPLGSTSVW